MPAKQPVSPSLAELTRRKLVAEPIPVEYGDDAVPHDGASGFLSDARNLWHDALLAADLLGEPCGKLPIPAEWLAAVRLPANSPLIPLALGHTPAMMGDLTRLMEATSGQALAPKSRKANDIGERTAFSGRVRVGGAVELNERAAILWAAGRLDEAAQLWETLPAGPVRDFNLGLCALAQNRYAHATASLNQAASALPTMSAWKHDASLLAAWAETIGAAR